MNLKFENEKQSFDFSVEYRKRKTYEIRIDPPNVVKVVAPIGAKEDMILKVVESKSKWIIKKLSYFREIGYVNNKKKYINGEVFMYLGKDYPLHIVLNELAKKTTVELYEDKLCITTDAKSEDIIKTALEGWYRHKTLENVIEKVEYFQRYFSVQPKCIKVKEQKKRWGSCGTNRHLLFNWRCSMAPSYVLDYIVVHEMCHLVQMNHSQDFWKLVETIMPNYKDSKEWLKRNSFKMNL